MSKKDDRNDMTYISGTAPFSSEDEAEKGALLLLDEYIEAFLAAVKPDNGDLAAPSFVPEAKRKALSAVRDSFLKRLLPGDDSMMTRLAFLYARCRMDTLKLLIFLLALAPELDQSYSEDFEMLFKNKCSKSDLGFAIRLAKITDDASRSIVADCLDAHGSASFWCMFEKVRQNAQSVMEQPLVLKPRVLQFLYGIELSKNDRLSGNSRIGSYAEILPKSYSEICIYEREYEDLANAYDMLLGADEHRGIIMLSGPEHYGKHFLLQRLSADTARPVLFIHIDKLIYDHVRAEDLAEDILLERLLAAQLIAFDGLDVFFEDGRLMPEAKRIVDAIVSADGYFFFAGKEKIPADCLADTPYIEVSLHVPTPAEKERLWEFFGREYEFSEDVDLGRFGSQYVLHPGEIPGTIKTAKMLSVLAGKDLIGKDNLVEAIRQHDRHSLGRMAVKIPCTFTWDDLVVGEKVSRQLRQICNQVKYRSLVADEWGFYSKTPYGRGIYALFFGTPGTGKTMAVQVIARELGLDLFRIDISSMVSKYIGETEKNITELFERAKEVNALLFFDEADSLFAKRSEGSDANDRSANAETAHLLQKMEEYEGIAVLATNLKANIDPAFSRRIKFMVHFEKPDAEIRKDLWRKVFPKEAPLAKDVMLDKYAEGVELSGSAIKEAAFKAAHLAAAEGSEIKNAHIIEALREVVENDGGIFTFEA